MSKKKKNSNAPETNDEHFEIDPRLEDAIFSKKDSLITITTNDVDGGLTASNFHLVYDAVEDRYNFYSDGLDKDQFFTLMHKFLHYCGIITIRTFLDEISHQHYTPDGRSIAIPFQEIKMFRSENKKIEQVDAAQIFLALMINAETGRFELDRYTQEEIYCDERSKVPAATFMEQLKKIIDKKQK